MVQCGDSCHSDCLPAHLPAQESSSFMPSCPVQYVLKYTLYLLLEFLSHKGLLK